MKSKTMLYLTALAVLALLSFVVLRQFGGASRPASNEAPRSAAMFLAVAADLEVGAFIEARDLQWREWSGSRDDLLLSRYFVKGVTRLEDIVGGVLREPLKAGQFLTTASLVRAGDSAFLAAVLRPGARAITIPVDAVSGSAGLIQPGNYVDVILASQKDRGAFIERPQMQARTLLSNLRVIAINRRVESLAGDMKKPSSGSSLERDGTATLEVTPKQAEMLALARGMGELSLSLRSLLGNEPANALPENSVTRDGDLVPRGAAPSSAGGGARVVTLYGDGDDVR